MGCEKCGYNGTDEFAVGVPIAETDAKSKQSYGCGCVI